MNDTTHAASGLPDNVRLALEATARRTGVPYSYIRVKTGEDGKMRAWVMQPYALLLCAAADSSRINQWVTEQCPVLESKKGAYRMVICGTSDSANHVWTQPYPPTEVHLIGTAADYRSWVPEGFDGPVTEWELGRTYQGANGNTAAGHIARWPETLKRLEDNGD